MAEPIAQRRPWWKRAFVWELPFLAALAAFMFWIRMIPFQSRLDPGLGRVYFAGSTDPFYHFRAIVSLVRNFPSGTRWDPWTYYPLGTGTGQFGTLFDWIPAAWVVLTKGKDAAEYDIAITLSIYTAIVGTIIIVPFYYLAKRFFGPIPAVIAAAALALMPGGFLSWGLATAGDHHGAEALGTVVSLLGVHFAAERAHLFRANVRRGASLREWRPVLIAGLVGGLALGVNMLLWPPALLFAGILTAWLTVVILLENAKKGGDARGLAAGGAISLVVAALMMLPVLDTTYLGEFNTYGLLHVLACLFAALWLVGVHSASRLEARHGWSPWIVPGIVAGAAVVVYVAAAFFFDQALQTIRWGLSWISGFGTPRETGTIGEAQPTSFFCTPSVLQQGQGCLQDSFGILPAATFLILLALIAWAVWKRNRTDILLAMWAIVIFRAVDTQARFGYYLAVAMALLLGWLAARLIDASAIFSAPTAVKRAKRGSRKAVPAEGGPSLVVRAAVAALAFLLVLPGNVVGGDRGAPSWEYAEAYAGVDPTMRLWLDGLDWMRENTPDAGVDLAKIYEAPPTGELYDYPTTSYGVLSWWDFGHWIEMWGKRPPVANPFQQAAPFAATWLTERSPDRAEELLTEWERGAPPVRYVFISNTMATEIYQPITYWANLHNGSRPIWPGGGSVSQREIEVNGQLMPVYQTDRPYTETMMSRLYDEDGSGLEHYRLVYEYPFYLTVGSVVDGDGNNICLHDSMPSRGCGMQADLSHVNAWLQDTQRAVPIQTNAYGYDLDYESYLKLFERVEGARLVGDAAPGAQVTAEALVRVTHADGRTRAFVHAVGTTADADGRFELVWTYPTKDFLSPAEGGTNAIARLDPTSNEGKVLVRAGGPSVLVDVTERDVLEGGEVVLSLPAP